MIINAGLFTFIVMILLIVYAFRHEFYWEDALIVVWVGIIVLFIASLICACNPKNCNIELSNLVQIKCSSSQTDKRISELEQKYNDLLKMKFDDVK